MHVTERRLLIVANDLHHEFGHRIRELKRYLDQRFEVNTVSLVPPGFDETTSESHGAGFLRGWPEQVILRGRSLIRRRDGDILIRRTPLPTIFGPYLNLLILKGVLRSIDLAAYDSILVQGPVPGKAVADTGISFSYDHADNYWGGRVDRMHRGLLGRWQDAALRSASAVSCAGESLSRHALSVSGKRSAVFPNGVHISDYSGERSETTVPTLVYVGGLERDCGLMNALNALAILPRSVRLVIAGSGPFARALKRRADSLRTDSVIEWLGPVDRARVFDLLRSSWIGLALFGNTPWNRHAFHLKVVEYMAAGLPFLTTPVGDGARIARSTGAGMVVEDDAEHISRAVSRLLDDAGERNTMAVSGRAAAESYDWALIGTAFATWIDDTRIEG